mgnify:CR=1 FL=1
MPLTYFLDYACPPREALGSEELVDAVRSRMLARGVRAQYAEAEKGDLPPEEMTFRRVVRDAEGTEREEPLSVADLEKEAAALDDHAAHCAGCPAALGGEAFGCVRQVSFPVSRLAEVWLATRVGEPETVSGVLFRQTAQTMKLGADQRIDQWREQGLLESNKPVGSGDPPATSSQLLEAMFLSGDLSPAQCLSLLLFLRALTTEKGHTPDEMVALIQMIQRGLSGDKVPEFVLALTDSEKDDQSIRELKTFLLAAFRAFSLGVGIGIRTEPEARRE